MGSTAVLAIRLARMGRADEAELAVAPLVWESPQDGAVRALQAWCMYRAGRRRRAVRAARRALQLRPDLDCARRLAELASGRDGAMTPSAEHAVEADICRAIVAI